MTNEKRNEILMHVAAALTTACFGNKGASHVNVVLEYHKVLDALKKESMLTGAATK